MKLDDVLRRSVGWYEARESIYLVGDPGSGKTETIQQVPKLLTHHFQKEHGIVTLNGPLLTPGDSIGYLMPKHMPDGRIESQYSEPFWWRTDDGRHLKDFAGGIIFVDEEDKADVDVKKVIGEAKLSGRLGPHHIPKGWVVWGAGNLAENRSGSTKELDHLINRRLQILVQRDLEAWTKWALTNGVSPLMVSFVNAYPELVIGSKAPEKQGPWCTPRSAVKWDKYLQILTRDNNGETPDDPSTVEECHGKIGDAAAQFYQHVKLEQEMPKYEKIVADPAHAKKPNNPASQMMICYHLAHKIKAADAAAVVQYVERFSPEFAVSFAKAACKRDQSLVLAPAFATWAKRNASLMAAISEYTRR